VELELNRRRFVRTAAISLVTAPALALARQWPVEGKHYAVVSPRQPTLDPKQVEVLEFFAYSCEICFAFEPILDSWQRKLPNNLRFRRIPVAFREGFMVLHQRLFFAIESLGLVEKLHHKIFAALHAERRRINKVEDIADFAARNGVDAAKLVNTVNLPAIAAKAAQATSLANGYRYRGTPSMGVDGRWLTSAAMAGSHVKALEVVEHLVRMARGKT
jgi:thiol:disulfide interchange protein DsbA